MVKDFNPRSREGSDCRCRRSGRDNGISIHAPAKGATSLIFVYTCINTNFNPRSREGSDHESECNWKHRPISIHAPAKGATDVCGCRDYKFIISIHAPAKGATLVEIPDAFSRIISIHAPAKGATETLPDNTITPELFQSTLPRRERQISGRITRNLLQISIHAPAKGATNTLKTNIKDAIFQSTLPRRERRERQQIRFCCMYFNPRSREGSDSFPVIR